MINPGALQLQGRKNVQEQVIGPTGQGTHLSSVSNGLRQLDLIQQQLHLEKALVVRALSFNVPCRLPPG